MLGVTLDDHLDLVNVKIRRPDVNVKPAGLVSGSASSVKRIGNLLKRRHARCTTKDRRDNLNASVSTVITHGRIRNDLPMIAGIVIVAFDLTRQTSRTDSLTSRRLRNPDTLNLNTKRPIRHHVYRITDVSDFLKVFIFLYF
jgi:hypothetical protein